MADILLVTRDKAGALAADRILADVFDDDIDAAGLAAYLDAPGHALFVARADDAVVGQARGCVHLQPDGPPELYIDNLGVAPAYKRRGIATALVRALIDWGRAQGCASMWVATETDNAEGLAFYKALGLDAKTMAYFETEISAV